MGSITRSTGMLGGIIGGAPHMGEDFYSLVYDQQFAGPTTTAADTVVAYAQQTAYVPGHSVNVPNNLVSDTMLISSAIGYYSPFADYVMRGQEAIPKELAIKRIAKYRKKHPEEFTAPLETMKKKVYGD